VRDWSLFETTIRDNQPTWSDSDKDNNGDEEGEHDGEQ
jgi:hypothetical protein